MTDFRDLPGYRRLCADQELFEAMIAFGAAVRDSARRSSRRNRNSTAVIEIADRDVRDHRSDELARRLPAADRQERDVLIVEARALHSARERAAIRRRLLRLWRERYGASLSTRACADDIMADIDQRRGIPKSTGSPDRDQLSDRIIICSDKISSRTIRRELIFR